MRGAAAANTLDMSADFDFLLEANETDRGFTVVPYHDDFSADSLPGTRDEDHGFTVAPAYKDLLDQILPQPYQVNLQSDPSNLSIFDKQTVFTPNRVAIDTDEYTFDELERLIPNDAVAINFQYQFFDLGKVNGEAGKYTIYFDKIDSAPMLVEGIVVVPEEVYQEQPWPSDVQIVSQDDLCCGVLVQETESMP
jgi:hypothetical protein